MKKMLFSLLSVGLFLFLMVGISKSEVNSIVAFCGSASKPATEEATRVFEKKTGINVQLHFGGSGNMLSQMKISRQGDVYIPGSPDYMALAEREGLVYSHTLKIIVYLVPAIEVQYGNPKKIQSLSDLAKPGIRVGIGNPDAVSVGIYAVELLEQNGLLNEVQKNIITHALSGSATASLLVMKKVDAIIGWRVFALWNPDKIDVIFLRPDEVPRLSYIPAAISTFSENREYAQKFIDFLTSPEGRKIYAERGYIVTEKEVREYAPKAKVGGAYQQPESYKPLLEK